MRLIFGLETQSNLSSINQSINQSIKTASPEYRFLRYSINYTVVFWQMSHLCQKVSHIRWADWLVVIFKLYWKLIKVKQITGRRWLLYSGASLIRTRLIRIIHLSGHMFGNQSPFLNRKWLAYPEIIFPDSQCGNGGVRISEARLYFDNLLCQIRNYLCCTLYIEDYSNTSNHHILCCVVGCGT